MPTSGDSGGLGRKTFIAGSGGLAAHLRVKYDASTDTVLVAGATDMEIGVTEHLAAAGDPITVILNNAPGTRLMTVSASVAQGATVEKGASGKVVTFSSGTKVGVMLSSDATADGHIGEVALV